MKTTETLCALSCIVAFYLSFQLIESRIDRQMLETKIQLLEDKLQIQNDKHITVKGDSFPVETTGYLCIDPKEKRYHGITASGEPCIPGHSAAVDPEFIPLGSWIYVPAFGKWFKATDTGNMIKGMAVDLAVDDEFAARAIGRQTMNVFVVDGF